jgi:glyoxylase-like metal-dependent hydrolase (beta-lactamase superfamily II)
MAAPRVIVDGLWEINLGAVNAFLIDDGELTLIDTGLPGGVEKLRGATQSIGKNLADVRHIIVTHCHPDHAGAAAAIKRMTTASVYMHPADAAMVQEGRGKRPMTPAPGLLARVMFNMFIARASGDIEPCGIDHEIEDGAELPVGGGLRAIHIPGHCAGQLALLWPSRHVLFVADAASNLPSLRLSLGYEDLPEGLKSLAKLAALDFDVACFGHGRSIAVGASKKFRERWGAQ